jgi:hypothetical protein
LHSLKNKDKQPNLLLVYATKVAVKYGSGETTKEFIPGTQLVLVRESEGKITSVYQSKVIPHVCGQFRAEYSFSQGYFFISRCQFSSSPIESSGGAKTGSEENWSSSQVFTTFYFDTTSPEADNWAFKGFTKFNLVESDTKF